MGISEDIMKAKKELQEVKKDYQKQSFAMEMFKEARFENNKLVSAIRTIAFLSIILVITNAITIMYVVHVLNDIETVETTETIENTQEIKEVNTIENSSIVNGGK